MSDSSNALNGGRMAGNAQWPLTLAVGPALMNQLRRPLLRWFPLLGWLALIFALSHQSQPLGHRVNDVQAAFIHTAEYMVLVFLAAYAAFGSPAAQRAPHPTLLLCFLFGLLYALSDEYHQSFIPGRQASVIDWLFDAVGAATAAVAVASVRRARSQYRRTRFLDAPSPALPSTAPAGPGR